MPRQSDLLLRNNQAIRDLTFQRAKPGTTFAKGPVAPSQFARMPGRRGAYVIGFTTITLFGTGVESWVSSCQWENV